MIIRPGRIALHDCKVINCERVCAFPKPNARHRVIIFFADIFCVTFFYNIYRNRNHPTNSVWRFLTRLPKKHQGEKTPRRETFNAKNLAPGNLQCKTPQSQKTTRRNEVNAKNIKANNIQSKNIQKSALMLTTNC